MGDLRGGSGRRRSVTVPGKELDVQVIITDEKSHAVFAAQHGPDVFVVFYTPGKEAVRVMSCDEANRFVRDVRRAHEALSDDEHISRLEGEFGGA